MQVNVIGDSGSRASSEVHPDVESIRMILCLHREYCTIFVRDIISVVTASLS